MPFFQLGAPGGRTTISSTSAPGAELEMVFKSVSAMRVSWVAHAVELAWTVNRPSTSEMGVECEPTSAPTTETHSVKSEPSAIPCRQSREATNSDKTELSGWGSPIFSRGVSAGLLVRLFRELSRQVLYNSLARSIFMKVI